MKGSNCVKGSRYTTLKISNKNQIKVSACFVFSPVCEYSVLVYPTGFDFVCSKIKDFFFFNPKSEMSASECQILGCLLTLQNFQFESPKMKLCVLGCPQ